MGFRQQDFVPFPNQMSPLTPPGKQHLIKVFQVNANEAAKTLKVVIPAGSSITNIIGYKGTAGVASSTLDIYVDNKSTTVSTATVAADTTMTTTSIIQMTNLPLLDPGDFYSGDLKISAKTTATSGGPFKFAVEYVV